jgi:hypothetical protein
LAKGPTTFLVMVYCLFTLTIGQFLPIYFVDGNSAFLYHIVVFIALLASTGILIFKNLYYKRKQNIHYSWLAASVTGIGIVLIFIVVRFIEAVAVWTDATVLYTNKSNSQIKIVTRYINEGAFGGGAEPNDYEIVLRRPITPYLKLETKIDTNRINKNEWIKITFDKYNTTTPNP